MTRHQRPAGELPAGPGHHGLVVAQPRVRVGRPGDGPLERNPRDGEVLAEPHPEPALGGEVVGDGARPVAGAQDADGDRARHGIVAEERVDVGVALALEVANGAMEGEVGVDGGEAFVASAAVCGATGHRQLEGQRSGRRGDESAGRRFGDDRHLPAMAAQHRREGAETAVLLADDAVDCEGLLEGEPAAPQGSDDCRLAATPAFMSQAPRPCSRPAVMRAAKGSCSHFVASPIGTTSTWPCRTRPAGPSPPVVPTRP